MKYLLAFFIVVSWTQVTQAESTNQNDGFDWFTFTLDNDVFVGKDNGYTNGVYFSLIDTPNDKTLPTASFWVSPLVWSFPDNSPRATVNSYSFSQALLSPSDITISNPGPNELPYSALLSFTNTFISIDKDIADAASTQIGIIGPWALGKPTQKQVHKLVGADDPKGWDTQLENEIAFQLTRARAWRSWASEDNRIDIVTQAELNLGTINSSIKAGAQIRLGEALSKSYATTLLSASRTANPIATRSHWFVYAGLELGYVFNQIFADGNTFRNSRSIDYDPEMLGATLGITKAWQNWSLSFAIVDNNLIEKGQQEDALENLTRFGTLTIAKAL